jgi:DNA repair protein RadC
MDGEGRPRERYLLQGPDDVGDVDLLALILGTGVSGRSALEVAAAALARLGGLQGLASSQPAQLADLDGIGPARAVRIHAALSLGGRAARSTRGDARIVDAEAAFRAIGDRFRGLCVEELHALHLDRALRPIAIAAVTRGSDAFTVVDPRQILRPAVQLGASALVIAHNHPSGDPAPSEQDRQITRRVASAARILGIRLLDHLVVAGTRYRSLAADGDLPPWSDEPTWTA